MKKLTKSSLLLAIFIFIYILPTKVFASELIFGSGATFDISNGNTNYFRINDTTNNIPKTFPSVAGNSSQSLGVLDLGISASGNGLGISGHPFNYLIFDTCATGYFQLIISNSSCGSSCVSTGTYVATKINNSSCVTGSYTGSRYLVQIPIQKWNLNEYSEWYEVSSYITYKSISSFYISNTLNRVFLSDEDYLVTYKNQQELVNKLDSVASAIATMQSGIITNNNTNTQNIINNQNSNAQQAHQDAQATQSAIGDVEDAVKDDTVSNNTGKSFFDNFSDNTHGLSGIITAPLNMINGLVNVSSTSCTDLTGTYQNTTFTVPCGKLLWGHTGVSQFNEFYNLVVGGALCYWIIRDLFLTIEALKDPDNDKVEVMSL